MLPPVAEVSAKRILQSEEFETNKIRDTAEDVVVRLIQVNTLSTHPNDLKKL